MKILVDADACPVKNMIVREAKKRGIPVMMVMDTSHERNDGYSQIVTVDKGADSADIKLINLTEPGDLVVTQDFGVAAMALGKGAAALNQNGMEYTEQNMDKLLFERHVGKEVRRMGRRIKGVSKRTAADDRAFETKFLALLERNTK